MLRRHLGIESPVMSGEKVLFHEPIPCGWMCSECKLVHRKHDLLRFSRCKRGTHTLVKANFVCNRLLNCAGSPGKHLNMRTSVLDFRGFL